ncbi:zinc finger C3HC-type protein 1 isoform X2 [Poecile atricapillus]|uniref:zinc finger C3HC-type protein 1-like isoform X2 n=1 Tax=Poecile atricapillus TaxID=48891 RepID=UPI0027389578|nr:zinc finger C3HC-type protein 1-like isoform X2 [Poecile atricapillus]XP_058721243.1 zinc finger C3HC-type protein 1 isoform X2 [Poecile atricapillus]
MAAPSAGGAAAAAAGGNRGRPPPVTPRQIRDLIDGGIATEGPGPGGKDTSDCSDRANGPSQMEALSLESASREAYFSRVETFTPLRWAGKPASLSPLVCARLGWVSVECDMLRCSSCQAYLCASLQLALDLSTYKERCEELRKALSTAHEKFCFWPDSPCPDRFARLLVDEPRVLLQDFLDRFQSLCQLELQLPSLRPEDLKNMSLTEERITRLLQLIGEELEHKGTEGEKPPGKFSTEILQVHVPACILALCGWTCSASSGSMNLSVITCSRCMRKVGLWGFHQLESSAAPEPDSCGSSSATPAAPERFPPVPTSPRRMLTRSQDPGSEQHEKSPSPAVSRPRGWDSPNSMDRGELDVSRDVTLRSRPVTRSMGQGDNMEVPSSPVRRAKRARLCSSSSSDTSLRSFFHPSSQHRDWCPWVSSGEGEESLEDAASQTEKEPGKAKPGWEVVLKRLLSIQKCDTEPETEPASLSEKSCKVFRIFRQWESMNSS